MLAARHLKLPSDVAMKMAEELYNEVRAKEEKKKEKKEKKKKSLTPIYNIYYMNPRVWCRTPALRPMHSTPVLMYLAWCRHWHKVRLCQWHNRGARTRLGCWRTVSGDHCARIHAPFVWPPLNEDAHTFDWRCAIRKLVSPSIVPHAETPRPQPHKNTARSIRFTVAQKKKKKT
jgi:hypothetical protein